MPGRSWTSSRSRVASCSVSPSGSAGAQGMAEVQVERLSHAFDLPLPAYATAGAAGLDLLAAVAEPSVLEPGAHTVVPTGIRLALPPDHEAQIRPRSGLAARHGVTVLNSPGTIDQDYRGELAVILI